MPKREHELVPVHKILSHNETAELLDTLGIIPNNLPKILASDPQVVKIGAKPGDIVKISRHDSGKSYDYFRYVIKD